MTKRASWGNNSILVGIVAYNTPVETLEVALQSLAKSDIDLDILLLCNSPDQAYFETLMSLRLEESNSSLRLERAENKGFGAGHNEIVELYSSPQQQWYVCCNPDVFVDPKAIHNLVTFALHTPDAIIVGPKILNPDGTIQPLSRQNISLLNWVTRQFSRLSPRFFTSYELTFDYEKAQTIDFVSGAFFLISVENFHQLNGFSSDFFLYFEDADLSFRAQRLGRNYYVPEAAVTHEWAKAWTRSSKALKMQTKSMFRYFIKNGFWGRKPKMLKRG